MSGPHFPPYPDVGDPLLLAPLGGRVCLALINCTFVPWTHRTPKANRLSDADPQDQGQNG